MEFALFFAINVVRIYKFAILARVLISWIKVDRSNKLVIFIYQSTEPVLGHVRRILPNLGMIDLSPLIAFFALDFLQMALMGVMADL